MFNWTIFFTVIIFIIAWFWYMTSMPGKSFKGKLTTLSAQEKVLRSTLEQHVTVLAKDIGERNVWNNPQLEAAADYIQKTWESQGFEVQKHSYHIEDKTYHNLYIEIPGGALKDEIVIIGAHYDSVYGSPGANDNGSGIAAILELPQLLKDKKSARTIRFVAFTNEEPPFYFSKHMGSTQYAEAVKFKNENITAMISVETIGYYKDETNTQKYPFILKLFYPSEGNFIGFVSNISSRKLVRRSIKIFRETTKFPSQGIAAPFFIPGIAWSDQWGFWRQGYQAIMVTDTAPFRYPYYHTAEDTPEKIDYGRTAQVLVGIAKVIKDLATS